MKKTSTIWVSAAVLLVTPLLANAAYYYEATTSAGGGGVQSVVHAWVDGNNSRVDFVKGGILPNVADGGYLLSNDGGKTLYLVNPDKKTISEFDFAKMFQMIGSLTDASQGMLKLEFSDFSTKKVSEAPGMEMLGYPTTHYQYETAYTMEIGVLGFSRKSRVETKLDFSCSKKLMDAGFAVWLRPDRFRTGNEGIDKLITQEFSAVNCLPLQSKTVTTMTDPKGNKRVTTADMKVTAIKQGAAPAGTFVLPANYEKVPLLPEVSGAGTSDGGNDAQEENKKPRFSLKDLLNR